MIIFLFAITAIFRQQSSYIGLVIYILLPAIMIMGLILIPLGMLLKIRRERRSVHKKKPAWPRIDLNDLRHRNAFLVFAVGTSLFLFISAIGSYEAFHYTESVEFCGTVCHSVMKPQYTAYNNSPHARVACVDCHVGEGASWYVRSKLSGLYQVYAVMAGVYPRPIPTPIKNLRPARETCERCHWPQKFYARQLHEDYHYLPDEENTKWTIALNMKIGGKHAAHGLKEGIHWHINPDIDIQYLATDESKQDIVFIRKINHATGTTTDYTTTDAKLNPDTLESSQLQTMDCMDCHNRPSHNYQPPEQFVDEAITAGKVPQQLPEIKSLAMEICAIEFSTMDSAMMYIENHIRDYYQSNYTEFSEKHPDLIKRAISGLQDEFSKNIFPEMRVRWDAYPNNIGHMVFDGCFRCHNDSFESRKGAVVSKDCNLCHNIVAQGTDKDMAHAQIGQSLPFEHPVDVGGAWQMMNCSECHTGLNP